MFLPRAFSLLLLASGVIATTATAAPKPNVLFIAIDDLRDWVSYLGHNAQSKTPNIDKLAARGVAFTHSYCAAPVCNPSRTALMSGMRPSTTGVYDNGDDWRKVVDPALTLNMHMKASGYETLASGKIYHESYARHQDWDFYLENEGGMPKVPAGQSDGVGGIKFAPLDCKDEDLNDWKIVNYAIEQLGKTHEKPLFLACGIHKPHMPWNVPKKYYDMHPLDQIELPPHLEPGKDLADVPPAGIKMAKPEGDHKAIVEADAWKRAVQGYLAAISYTDMLIGRLMEAYDKSPMKDNTMICFWCDHGWHLGEKEHWRKFALWEEATRAPLLWVVPGLTKPNSICDRTVDFMSIYPTMCDLCGIDTPKHVEGKSIRSLLADPKAPWDMPAMTTYEFNNHAVRDETFRYIRYDGGDEELYNQVKDPNGWTNLAGDSNFTETKEKLGKFMPTQNKADMGGKGEPGEGSKKGEKGKKAEKKKMKQEAK